MNTNQGINRPAQARLPLIIVDPPRPDRLLTETPRIKNYYLIEGNIDYTLHKVLMYNDPYVTEILRRYVFYVENPIYYWENISPNERPIMNYATVPSLVELPPPTYEIAKRSPPAYNLPENWRATSFYENSTQNNTEILNVPQRPTSQPLNIPIYTNNSSASSVDTFYATLEPPILSKPDLSAEYGAVQEISIKNF